MPTKSESFPVPDNEEERLEELNRFQILDTPPEESFDRLTNLAVDIFDVPIALVSLIDDDRQWWKSCIGVDERQTDRELAFCNYPVAKQETLVVEDASEDDRFTDNELVTGEMNIRFYAGAPMMTDSGHALGTFCLIDTEPRELTESEISQLEALAEEAFSQMELRLTKNKLQERNEDLRVKERSLSSIKEGITITDPTRPDNPIVYVNTGFETITGYSEEDALGRNCRFLQGQETSEEKLEKIRRAIKNRESISLRLRNYRKSGEMFWNHLSIHPVQNDDGKLTHFVGIQQDITDLIEMEQALEIKANYDELTGLFNRGTLLNAIQDLFKQSRSQGTLILIDLDHFKDINDEFGHVTGDRVLETVGTIIDEETREEDLIGRYGGEEFGIYLKQSSLQEGTELAERIRTQLEQTNHTAESGESFTVTGSFGITLTDPENDDLEVLLKRADEALYEAKSEGRNQIKVSRP
ncbi:MAG: diguanylate cyclase [bacterium]